MSKSWRYTLSIICLLVLVLLLWRSPETEEFISSLALPENTAHYPNAIMEESQTVQFNALGEIDYQLTTEQARFFEKSATNAEPYVEYQKPKLVFYGNTPNAPLVLRSEKGYSRDNAETIALEGNVSLTQTLSTGEQYTLTTEALSVLPARQFAQTNKPVIITAPSGVTTATGLNADLKTQRIELLSNVRGRYVQ